MQHFLLSNHPIFGVQNFFRLTSSCASVCFSGFLSFFPHIAMWGFSFSCSIPPPPPPPPPPAASTTPSKKLHHQHNTINTTPSTTTPSSTDHQHNTINTTPSTQHHQPITINTTPSTHHHQHNTINPSPSTQNHQQHTINTTPSTPSPSTQHHHHNTINPSPSTQHHQHNTISTTHHEHNIINTSPSAHPRQQHTIKTTPSTQHHHHIINTSPSTTPSTQHHQQHTINTTPSTHHRIVFVWQAQHLEHVRFVFRGTCSTWSTFIKVSGSPATMMTLTPRRFAWQAQHLEHLRLVLRGRRSTWSTSGSFFATGAVLEHLLLVFFRGRRRSPATGRRLAGAALGASPACSCVAGQGQHLEHLRFVLRGRRSTWSTFIEVRGSPATSDDFGRGVVCAAGAALGAPPAGFAWQAHWSTSGSFCVAGAALRAPQARFAWQAQHLEHLHRGPRKSGDE